jgi:hypothetical protein
MLIAVDEKIELFQQIIPHLSKPCKTYLNEEWTEAAVCFIIDAPRDKHAPCIAAAGPRRLIGSNPQQAFVELAGEIGLNDQEVAALNETSDSFLKPALVAHGHYNAHDTGDFCIGSYSPSAQAIALVSLCL